MAILLAQGSGWSDLVAQGAALDNLLEDGEVGELAITGPFPLPDFVLTAIKDGVQLAGIQLASDPYMDGNTLHVAAYKHSPLVVAILGAIGSVALAIAGAFLIGVVAWQLTKVAPEEVANVMKIALVGATVVAAIFIFNQGGSR